MKFSNVFGHLLLLNCCILSRVNKQTTWYRQYTCYLNCVIGFRKSHNIHKSSSGSITQRRNRKRIERLLQTWDQSMCWVPPLNSHIPPPLRGNSSAPGEKKKSCECQFVQAATLKHTSGNSETGTLTFSFGVENEWLPEVSCKYWTKVGRKKSL